MCLKVIINILTGKGIPNFTLYDGNTKMVKMDSVSAFSKHTVDVQHTRASLQAIARCTQVWSFSVALR